MAHTIFLMFFSDVVEDEIVASGQVPPGGECRIHFQSVGNPFRQSWESILKSWNQRESIFKVLGIRFQVLGIRFERVGN